jgi:hypothetical protein
VRAVATVVAVAALLALPGSAAAANLYVDDNTGDDLSDCSQIGPCETIANALAQSDPNDTIVVDGGEYNETLTVGGGRSLSAQDFSPPGEGETLIDGGLDTEPAIEVAFNDPAGTIEGFTIRSKFAPVVLDGAATLRDNILDEPDEPSQNGADVFISSGAGSPTIEDNTFSDATTTDDQIGIRSFSTGTPTISGNELSGFATAIDVQRGSPSISNNDVSGFHSESFSGIGIRVGEGNPTIEDNFVHGPGGDNPGPGIFVSESPTPGDSGAELARNRVIGPGTGVTSGVTGVAVTDAAGAVTMDSDVIAGFDFGLSAGDNGGDGGGDVSLENVTVADNVTFEIFANETHVTLDSSIVGAEGIASVLGTGTCTVTFTDLVPGGTPPDSTTCGPDAFQHNLDPMFVDADASNYHLQPGSPLVDAGNPASPAAGTTDPDGDARVLDGDKNCVARRDIGADELVPAPPPPDCTSGGPPPPNGGPPPGGDAVSNEFSFGKVKKNKKRGTAKLTVSVPGAGELELAKSKKVKGADERVDGAGEAKLRIKPKCKAKGKLNDLGKAKVNAAVTFAPDGGEPSTQSKRVKLVKR